MFSSEDGAYTIINEATTKYKKHFNAEFPLYEYIHITRNETYDFSVKGANRLSKFIDKCISAENAVLIPVDYEERLY